MTTTKQTGEHKPFANAIKNAKIEVKDNYKATIEEFRQDMFDDFKFKPIVEKIDRVYDFTLKIKTENKEQTKQVLKQLSDNAKYYKNKMKASHYGWSYEDIDDTTVDFILRYQKSQMKITGKEYDKENEIEVTKAGGFLLDYDKIKSLIGKEIKMYDEYKSFPISIMIEKIDDEEQLVFFNKQISLIGHSQQYGGFGAYSYPLEVFKAAKIYKKDYTPFFGDLPDED